jgi:regulator-associated protein of mTOR
MVRVWKEHRSWLTNVHLQRGGQRELVSACRNGEVKLWDLRWEKSVRTIRATKDTLRTLSVHEHAPVFAVGTDRHAVRVFSMLDMPPSTLPSALSAAVGVHNATRPSTSNDTSFSSGNTIPTMAAGTGTATPTTSNATTGAQAGASPAGGKLLSTFEPYSSFLHQSRGAPIAATAFHPHRMMIAGAALGDTHINIYACRKSTDA